MSDVATTQIDLSEIKRRADRIWATKDPEGLLVLIRSLDRTMTQLGAARGELISSWRLEDVLQRDELEGLLEDWDERANKLWFRLGAYIERTEAIIAGELSGEFTAYVVQPLFVGHGYASPDREAWAKVDFPDLLTPFRLWNELGAFARGTRLADYYRREAQAIVALFGRTIRDEASRVAGDVGAAMRREAERLLDDASEIADAKRGELSDTILLGILGGALLLGVGGIWLARRRKGGPR